MLPWIFVIRRADVGPILTRVQKFPAHYVARSFLSISNSRIPAREKKQTITTKDRSFFTSVRHHLRSFLSSELFKPKPNARKQWDELEDVEKNLWVRLGWSSTSWLNGPPPESERKTWDQLSDEEKAAARTLKLGLFIPHDHKLHDPLWAKDSFDGAKQWDQSFWSEGLIAPWFIYSMLK
jgi:hypothetical protein